MSRLSTPTNSHSLATDAFYRSSKRSEVRSAASGAKSSAGVLMLRDFRGRLLSSRCTRRRFAGEWMLRSVPLREVLSQQAVDVFARGSLPYASPVAEVDRQARGLSYRIMLSQFGSVIPGQRSAHRGWYLPHRFRDARSNGCSWLIVWNMHQHREPTCSFNESPDR